MKRGAIQMLAVMLGGLVAASSCTREHNEVASTSAGGTPAKEKAAAVEGARRERESMFGEEARQADVQWQENGLGYRIASPGTPPKPGIGDVVRITYTGRLRDGTVFDRTEKPAEFQIGRTIPGLSTGLQMMGNGGRATFFIPPQQGYGARKVMGIPPNSALIFDVEVLAVNP